MIHFNCPECGKGFTVPDDCAGKKGKCSRCNSVVFIHPRNTDAVPRELQMPQCVNDMPEHFVNNLNEKFKNEKNEENLKRKYPWPIDMFFYPLNVAGIAIIFILAGIPFLIMSVSFLMLLVPVIGPFVSLIGSLINCVINIYAYFYLCQCIQNSACGYVRLSVNISEHSDLGETFFIMLRIFGCLILFFGPALVRMYQNIYKDEEQDKIFYYLLAGGAALFPISLLSVVMHDSLLGLNPFLLIAAIFKTLFQYIGLVMIFCVGILAIFYISRYITKTFKNSLCIYTIAIGIVRFIKVYLLMIIAHLIGRFYYKNSERLNWEV